MATTLASAGLSGALFGAALAASGVFTPAVVLAQMRFEDFHMMKVFLTASAGSALIVNLFSRLGIARVPPRSSSSIGLFGTYDGNILGGLSIGFGMALAGACPGTVFVQVGAGVSSGIVCLAGGIVGGLLYGTGLIDKLLSPFKASTPISNGKPASATPTGVQNAISTSNTSKSQSDQLTVHGKFNLSINTALLGFEVMCVSAITLVTYLFDEDPSIMMTLRTSSGALHPVVGGALVASAQAASLLLTGGALGASAFYADAARYVLKALNIKGPGGSPPQTPSPKSIVFTLGIMGAGYLVSSKIPDIAFAASAATAASQAHPANLSVARSFLGGLCLAVGARLAGGCTSGHGISGMSSMSLASFVSVAAMFAGGMGLAVFV